MTNEEIIHKIQAIEEQAQAMAQHLFLFDIGQAKAELSRMMINIIELQCQIVEEDPTLSPDILD